MNDKNAITLFMQGFKEMLKQLEPKEILIYGNKLSELDGYKNLRWLPANHPEVNKKWDAIDKQMSVLNDARSKSNIRSQAYLLAVNEKYNIRAKYNSNDMKSMTNGQLNSLVCNFRERRIGNGSKSIKSFCD